MAGVFDDDIAVAAELIALYGADCTWHKAAAPGAGEPGYPTATPAPAGAACKIVFFSNRDLGRGSEEFLSLLAGIEVPTNQEVGLMAGSVPFTPEMTDTIKRGATELAIKKIDRLAPNGTPILYYVTVAA